MKVNPTRNFCTSFRVGVVSITYTILVRKRVSTNDGLQTTYLMNQECLYWSNKSRCYV